MSDGRGIRTIMNGTTLCHTNGNINSKYIDNLIVRSGSNYMRDFKRPAYYNTPLEQNDIHEYRRRWN